MSDTLKECPFCGGGSSQLVLEGEYEFEWIECNDCGAQGPFMGNEGAAITSWNHRPSRWQPISTVPKDGTQFDLWWIGQRYTDCWWEKLSDCFYDNEGRIPNPSHWMPIPAAPKED